MSKIEVIDAVDQLEFYFYVREPCGHGSGEFQAHAQGFAKRLEFLSELIEGRISIDGLHSFDIGLGDSFIVDARPEYKLKGVRFIV